MNYALFKDSIFILFFKSSVYFYRIFQKHNSLFLILFLLNQQDDNATE